GGRLVGVLRIVAMEEVDDVRGNLLIHALRAFQRQRALILASLFGGRAVWRLAPQHVPWRRQAVRGLGVHRAGHLWNARYWRVFARRRNALRSRIPVDVWKADLLHCVEMVEVAPEFVEAVRGRQGVGVIAEMVLAELTGVVADVTQEHRHRRGTWSQVGRAAR